MPPNKARLSESEDSASIIEEKCLRLVELLREAKCPLVYTGAGISTAASIPDYRGPRGLWTLARQGKVPTTRIDPIASSPTTAHIVLKELCRQGWVRHILSQNCDGLHLRSGIPQRNLSEIHGNTNVEVCPSCDKEYIRNFDVTANSGVDCHKTDRTCISCSTNLVDTIVYFGEKRAIELPLNWKGVLDLIPQCDLIICLGTSLQVLKHYKFLWPKNTKLAIINLQWTPKDNIADLKINGRCDDVMINDCDPINQPRINARLNEIMNKFTDCNCHRRAPRLMATRNVAANCSFAQKRLPKWMTVPASKAAKLLDEYDEEAEAEPPVPKEPKKRGRKRKVPLDDPDSTLYKIQTKRGSVEEESSSTKSSNFTIEDSVANEIKPEPMKRGRKPKKRRGRKPKWLIEMESRKLEEISKLENLEPRVDDETIISELIEEMLGSFTEPKKRGRKPKKRRGRKPKWLIEMESKKLEEISGSKKSEGLDERMNDTSESIISKLVDEMLDLVCDSSDILLCI